MYNIKLFFYIFLIISITYIIYNYTQNKIYKLDKIKKINNKYLVIQFDNRLEFFETSDLNKLTSLNKEYCRKHDLDYTLYASYNNNNLPVYWIKVKIIRDILNTENQYDAIIWLDTDAVFSMDKDICTLIKNTDKSFISCVPSEFV